MAQDDLFSLKRELFNEKAEQNLLASIMYDNDALLEVLDCLKPDHFHFKEHKVIFQAMFELFTENNKIDYTTIIQKLENKNKLDEAGGENYIYDIAEYITSSVNIKSYAKIILDTHHLQSIYDTSLKLIGVVNNSGEINDIRSEVQNIVLNVFNDPRDKKVIPVKDGIRSVFQQIIDTMGMELEENNVVGLKMGFVELDRVLDGLQPDNLITIAADSSVGKAQPLYSKILTPNGWITMGEVKLGDQIVGSNGNIYNITNIFPQGERDIYRIYFDDNSFADCDLNHLWYTETVLDRAHGGREGSVKTTKEIIESLKYKGKTNHSINFVKPINFSSKELPLSPYLLGVYLGDGHCYKSENVRICNTESDILDKLNQLLPITDCLSGNYKPRIKRKQRNNNISTTKEILIDLELINKKSYEKFIPKDYLYSSIIDRLELLRGLLDTDGYIGNTGCFEFSTTSKQLRDDIIFLVHSLGGRIAYTTKQGIYVKDNIKNKTREYYRMVISFEKNIVPVSSKKHLGKYTQRKRSLRRFIKKIEYIGKFEAQCIMVNSPDKLYITDNFILTHNSSLATTIASNVMRADPTVPILYFSLEMSEEELNRRLLSIESGIEKYYLKHPHKWIIEVERVKWENRYTQEWTDAQDKFISIVKPAKERIESYNIHIDDSPRLTVYDIVARAKKFNLQHGRTGLVVVDHAGRMKPHVENALIFDYTRMVYQEQKNLAKELKCPVISLQQLNDKVHSKKNKIPDLSCLKGGSDIRQESDIVMFIYRPDAYKELKGQNPEGYTTIFIEKNRDGNQGRPEGYGIYFNSKTTRFEDKKADYPMKDRSGE